MYKVTLQECLKDLGKIAMVSVSVFLINVTLLLLKFGTGFVRHNPCVEPSLEDLQREFEQLNYFHNLKALFFPEGWNNETIESEFIESLALSSEYKESGVCPEKHITDASPLMLRTSCPWFLSADTDENRYPKTIYSAETYCNDGCIGNPGQICESISRRINVLVHKDGDCVNGLKQYRLTYYDINIAYVCAQRPEIEQYW